MNPNFTVPDGTEVVLTEQTPVKMDSTVPSEPHEPPAWVDDTEMSQAIWGAYHLHLQGAKSWEIAVEIGVSARTVYRYISMAKTELPFETVALTHELIEERRVMLRRLHEAADELMRDPAMRIDRKAVVLAKLATASESFHSGIEELLGMRRKGTRVNINADKAATQFVFNMDDEKPQQAIEGTVTAGD